MDELVELLEFLLIVNFLGMRGDGTQTVHDVILHKHRGITPHGKGDGIAGASVQYMLAIFAKNNNRRIKHRRLSAHDLDSLEAFRSGRQQRQAASHGQSDARHDRHRYRG